MANINVFVLQLSHGDMLCFRSPQPAKPMNVACTIDTSLGFKSFQMYLCTRIQVCMKADSVFEP
jgi:hypothetical protein